MKFDARKRTTKRLLAGVFLLFTLLLAGCGNQGPSESEIQLRVDEAVAEALANAEESDTSIASTTTSTRAPPTTTQVVTPSTTTTNPATTTTLDLLDPSIVRERFVEKVEEEIARVAPRLPVEGMSPDHSAEYQPPYLFDIETTDSIISPFKGTLVIPILWYYQGELTGLMYLHATYNYTDFEWKFASAVRYIDETTSDLSAIRTEWVESLFR